MKILVTGGLGFIGSNFITNLAKSYPNYKITNIDAKFIGSNPKNLYHLRKNKNYKFVHGDITNSKLMDKIISKSDVVFNFAAESHVDRSITSPKSFIDSNILGVFTILESIRKHNKKLIHVSTDEVFGSLRHGSAKETSVMNPSSPYASSKASAELLVKSYFTTYNLDVLITRCTNNFGPLQFPEKFIPKIILNALKNKKIPVYGSGKNIRDWIYVIDHCEAIMRVYEKGKKGESYNISGKNEITNMEIVKQILQILNKPTSLITHVKDRLGHDFRYSLDSSKIRNKLNWKPRFTFKNGLSSTIEWYVANPSWWNNVV